MLILLTIGGMMIQRIQRHNESSLVRYLVKMGSIDGGTLLLLAPGIIKIAESTFTAPGE